MMRSDPDGVQNRASDSAENCGGVSSVADRREAFACGCTGFCAQQARLGDAPWALEFCKELCACCLQRGAVACKGMGGYVRRKNVNEGGPGEDYDSEHCSTLEHEAITLARSQLHDRPGPFAGFRRLGRHSRQGLDDCPEQRQGFSGAPMGELTQLTRRPVWGKSATKESHGPESSLPAPSQACC